MQDFYSVEYFHSVVLVLLCKYVLHVLYSKIKHSVFILLKCGVVRSCTVYMWPPSKQATPSP